MAKDVSLVIGGHGLTFRSDEKEEYLRKLASQVEKKMKEVTKGQAGITTLSVAISAALGLADELHKLKDAQGDIDTVLGNLGKKIDGYLAKGS
tara:strand:+ start:17 stop:295 length:279 start_codon:yes stop_codon:yes gene_type:complete